MRQQHGHYASEQISGFVTGLGPFFQKYIERGLARIDAELSVQQQSHQNDATSEEGRKQSVAEYREKLALLRQQMFGSAEDTLAIVPKPTTGISGSGEQSPVRTRLDSPAAKFARISASANASPVRHGAHEGIDLASEPRDTASSISSLKERLAKLKSETAINK